MTKTKFIIYVSMIAFLFSTVQQVSAQENSVPDWIRQVAGWWYEGSVSTDEYLSSIKWLIENDVISVIGIAMAQTDPEKPVQELQVESDSQDPALVVKNENNESLTIGTYNQKEFFSIPGRGTSPVIASCDEGDVVTGGGGGVDPSSDVNDGTLIVLLRSTGHSTASNIPLSGWFTEFYNPYDVIVPVFSSVICLDLPPLR